ncbi:slipin family protein [Thermostaphylospora chromogena]|uniref:Regulator of protease activity HflC, stomatin/prohibitin superfamily n=1 Tax=Thermostaphylospora chromogena TaxID=35622 RepID=A0A1H1I450_9ACTN|nr:slipin family protein [Thermostaphylospora chromogena]SDR32420.1 Regulator of protease activity HflC, stomatin/prohibitin superfamily [Thermostaphylospora chromogena]
MLTYVLFGVIALLIVLVLGGVRIVNQVERGIVFRFGKTLPEIRPPGLTPIIPFVDRLQKVNVQIVTMPVPTQEGITRDNVSVRVDAVVYFRVVDPMKAVIYVQDYLFAVGQVAQTSLRSIIGKSELDDLLSNREELNRGLALMIDSPALGWGIHLDRVEIKDVQLPEGMKRSMSRQAEAERERRARVITADGELMAARKLSDAAATMHNTPGAFHLRLLQTVVEVAAEKSSTLVMPFPVELLRFFDRFASDDGRMEPAARTTVSPGPAAPPAVTEPPASDDLRRVLRPREAETPAKNPPA